MRKVYVFVLIGIPASGKSTFCAEALKSSDNVVRVGRDGFRYMLCNKGLVSPKVENIITGLHDKAILDAIASGMSVLVDNTHCRMKYINALTKILPEGVEVVNVFFDVDVDTAIGRDAARSAYVGAGVISDMAGNLAVMMQNNAIETVTPSEALAIIKTI